MESNNEIINLLNNILDLLTLPNAVSAGLIGIIIYWIKNPSKFEKFVALINKGLKLFFKKSEYAYIKYDIQGKINDYIAKVKTKVDHINSSKAVVNWIDTEVDEQTFINNGKLVLRMHKSDNQNKNLVNACVSFVSHSFLRPSKAYLAKYQRDALDMYVCYDLFKEEKQEILNQFVDDFLREKLDTEKVGDFFDLFIDLDKASLLYPIFVQELTYLGEKVFTKKKNYSEIHNEVSGLVNFLHRFSQRTGGDDKTPSEYDGPYCSFVIRIIGKSFKIDSEGKRVYLNNLKKLNGEESLYLLSKSENKEFVDEVVKDFTQNSPYKKIRHQNHIAIIRNKDDEEISVDSYMVLLRKEKTEVLKRTK
jgi:hypothetical protein